MSHSPTAPGARGGRARLPAALCALALAAAAPADEPAREVLGPGDTVRVTVFQHPDLGGELRLSERGSIVLPLAGEVALAGLTPAAAGQALERQLARGRYVVDPHVSVALVEVRSRQVSVLGEVARPGQYPLDSPGLTLTELLARAGGVTPAGGRQVIAVVTRGNGRQRLEIDVAGMFENGDLTPDIELQGGDSLFVPEAPVFYIYGEVQRAGAYRLAPDTPVMGALALGGGLTPRGTLRGLTIHRRQPDGTLQRLAGKPGDMVLAGDVIHVAEGLF